MLFDFGVNSILSSASFITVITGVGLEEEVVLHFGLYGLYVIFEIGMVGFGNV